MEKSDIIKKICDYFDYNYAIYADNKVVMDNGLGTEHVPTLEWLNSSLCGHLEYETINDIDEFYLILQNPASSKFLQMIWKRARKWGGIPTGMTQNVEDLLRSAEARTILSTSDFVMLLSQAPIDRAHLSELLNISPGEQEYITNAAPGHGLIYNGSTLIPFEDKFPTDTELYKVMTSKADESTDR